MTKKMYETDYGEQFTERDEAIESVINYMSLEELFDALEDKISKRTLLEWAWNQPQFLDDFNEETCEAEYNYAKQFVSEIEIEEEDF